MKDKVEYRVTWRHEVHFMASSDHEARIIFDTLYLGHLDQGIKNKLIHQHEWVEGKSFECIDDDYRDVKWVTGQEEDEC